MSLQDDNATAKRRDILELEARISYLERAVRTLVWWLVSAQTGFGAHDARGIEQILGGETVPGAST